VIGQSRGENPYAQQNVAAAPSNNGNYNAYAAPQAQYDGGNPYANNQYGQQTGYAQGGAAPAVGGDFWSELSDTNSNLSSLQEQIQAVRSAHQSSLVRTTERYTS
jgi:syntaxin 1B/2/3